MDKITENLLSWYNENKRDLPWRRTKNPYYIWISEIMLQQTRVEAVKVYYERFIKRLPTLEDLANIEEDDLLKLWEGLGYYSRVRNMQKAAKLLIEEGKSTLPNTKEDLLKLPGIGEYTAGAILSIAYLKPTVAIDGNVYRILSRYYMIYDSISKKSSYVVFEKKMKKILFKEKPDDMAQAFMDLGSSICVPKNPKCEMCPLKEECKARKKKKQEQFPVKEKKQEKKIEEKNIYLFVYKDKVLIKKRKSTGLLASMYEFVNDEETKNVLDIENKLDEQKIPYKTVVEIGESKHVFSHVIWYMKGYKIELKEPIVLHDAFFVTKKELKEKYSIPSAFSYYANYFMKK